MKFITTSPFKDGNLTDKMQAESLPLTLVSTRSDGTYIVYECSAYLLRAMLRAGAHIVVLPNDPQELEDVLYVHEIRIVDMHPNALIETPIHTQRP